MEDKDKEQIYVEEKYNERSREYPNEEYKGQKLSSLEDKI